MTSSVRVGGAWKTVAGTFVKVGGAWKQAQQHIKVGGVWKAVGATLSLDAISDPISAFVFGGPAEANVSLQSDGDIETDVGFGGGDVGDWITPKAMAGAAYEARMTVNSGSVSAGTTGSWLALSSTRTWTQTRNTAGLQTANVTLEIREASTGTVKASKTFSFSAEYGS